MKVRSLVIINEAPYGSERCYNALRVAHALMKQPDTEMDIFLIADAVNAARKGQKTPRGYYNIELMLKRIILGGGGILLCGTCMDARGITEAELIEGTRKGTMAELTGWTQWADKVLAF